jgi:hypothetical protein
MSAALIAGTMAAHNPNEQPRVIATKAAGLGRLLAAELGLKTEAELDAEYRKDTRSDPSPIEKPGGG